VAAAASASDSSRAAARTVGFTGSPGAARRLGRSAPTAREQEACPSAANNKYHNFPPPAQPSAQPEPPPGTDRYEITARNVRTGQQVVLLVGNDKDGRLTIFRETPPR
jgi:hypothetical protein